MRDRRIVWLVALVAASCNNGSSSVDIPTCSTGQVLTASAGKLQCQAIATGDAGAGTTVPTCASGQVLSAMGGQLTCVTPMAVPAVPACAAGQVLTAMGGTFQCVAVMASEAGAPTCGAGEVLTSMNGSLRCVVPAVPPTCNGSQVLTAMNGTLVCVTPAGGPTVPMCAGGQVLSSSNGALVCVTVAASDGGGPGVTIPSCTAGQVLTSNNGAFQCTTVVTAPSCTTGQVLGAMNGALVCVTPSPGLTVPTCAAGDVLIPNGAGGLACSGTLAASVATLQSTVSTLQSTLTTLQTTVTSLQTRVTALESAASSGGIKNRYVGLTTVTTTGTISSPGSDVGIKSATAICVAQYGAGAHMCAREEIYESVAAGSSAFGALTTVLPGWIWAPAWNEPVGAVTIATTGTGTGDNCASYTYNTADTNQRGATMEWKPWAAGRPPAILINGGNLAACNAAHPIHCCK
jgi:hypothetical protein